MPEILAPYPVLTMASLDTLATDYRTITEACGLLDRSERGKLALTGSDAAGFLQGQVTNDVEGLSAGGGCYAAFLTPKGKMLGDLRILATDGELLLDTERVALQALFNMIRRFSIGYDVELHKRTLERGLLSLIGPDAARGRRRSRACPPTSMRMRSCRCSGPGWRPVRSGPTSGSTCCARRATPTRCGPRSRTPARSR